MAKTTRRAYKCPVTGLMIEPNGGVRVRRPAKAAARKSPRRNSASRKMLAKLIRLGGPGTTIREALGLDE